MAAGCQPWCHPVRWGFGEGTASVWRGAGGGEGKVLPQGAVGMERPAQGSRHGPQLLEFRKHLNNTLRHGGDFQWSCVEPGVRIDEPS